MALKDSAVGSATKGDWLGAPRELTEAEQQHNRPHDQVEIYYHRALMTSHFVESCQHTKATPRIGGRVVEYEHALDDLQSAENHLDSTSEDLYTKLR